MNVALKLAVAVVLVVSIYANYVLQNRVAEIAGAYLRCEILRWAESGEVLPEPEQWPEAEDMAHGA